MPVIWAAISGHGYGHAAQVVPVLNELGKLVPGLTSILRTTVPHSFFQDRLAVPWTIQPVQQDVGCVQQGPLHIDLPTTWNAHRRFHKQWDEKVKQEMAAMRSAGPRVVVADTPYLAICAASKTGFPAVGLANFTWNEILVPLARPDDPCQQALLAEIEQSYRAADTGLRISPGLAMSAFRRVTDVGPIAEPAVSRRTELRAQLNIPASDSLVLMGFGGIPLPSLPWETMENMQGYRFIVDGSIPRSCSRIVSLKTLPYGFKTVLASVDVVMTKPGYGTVVEAVMTGLAVLYVRRYNFADEQPLVDFLQRYGRGLELSLEDFQAGNWEQSLRRLCLVPLSGRPPSCAGAKEAAAVLAGYF